MTQNEGEICLKVAIVKQQYCCLVSDNCQI
jgi:hypothetical protein